MKRKISKKAGITIFVVIAVIMAALIVFHQNPGANQQEELLLHQKLMKI